MNDENFEEEINKLDKLLQVFILDSIMQMSYNGLWKMLLLDSPDEELSAILKKEILMRVNSVN